MIFISWLNCLAVTTIKRLSASEGSVTIIPFAFSIPTFNKVSSSIAFPSTKISIPENYSSNVVLSINLSITTKD